MPFEKPKMGRGMEVFLICNLNLVKGVNSVKYSTLGCALEERKGSTSVHWNTDISVTPGTANPLNRNRTMVPGSWVVETTHTNIILA